jgi:pilus assembly protein CpaB
MFAFVLLLGIGLAGFAVYMAQGYIQQMSAERDMLLAARAQAKPTVEIFAVTEPLDYGETLGEDQVTKILWQQDSLPEGAFTDLDALFPPGEDERIILRRMEAFEPILSTKVTAPGEDAGITNRLSRGNRAFAISVDVSSGVSGFLRPGDRVDVYWTGVARDREITKLIETSVLLIAVDQMSDTGRSTPLIARTVTVEVNPQQVAALAQAQTTGRLSLSLVGAEDDTVAMVEDVDQQRLLGIEDQAPEIVAAAPVIEAPKICTTRVRRGAEVVVQQIPCSD